MAQTLDEQIAVVERALAECMVETALVVVRSWLNELGENNPYEEAYNNILQGHRALFSRWLNVDDPHDEGELTRLTGEAYRLVDAVYAEMRVLRGQSPDMHGFNGDSAHSVMNYFSNCVRFRPEDLEWYHSLLNREGSAELALVAVTALTQNLRHCFSQDAMLSLIEGMTAENEMAAGLSAANSMLLLVQYDDRIDFFPQLQDAFVNGVNEEDSSDRLFELLLSLIQNEKVMKILPGHIDDGYLSMVIPLIPHSWLYSLLIEGSTERERRLAYHMIQAGYRDPLWEYPDLAEKVYLDKLRGESRNPMDYINYAHCLLMRGDRMMAYENYHQARQLCGTSKEFFSLFRPDRKQLIDHGIPMEHVYLIEDQLINA